MGPCLLPASMVFVEHVALVLQVCTHEPTFKFVDGFVRAFNRKRLMKIYSKIKKWQSKNENHFLLLDIWILEDIP